MYKVTVEGKYETMINSATVKYEPFKLTFEVARTKKDGIETHLQKRLIPYYLKTVNQYKTKPFIRLHDFNIIEIEKLDKEIELFGKDVLELEHLEIQNLAALYDLYEVPLYGVYTLEKTRELCALAYMKKVIKLPMKTPHDKKKLPFLVQNSDGSFKADFSNTPCPIVENKALLETKSQTIDSKIDVSKYFEAIEKANEKTIDEDSSDEQKEEIDNKLDNLDIE